MNDKIVIRMLMKDDYSSWKALWDRYNAFYGRHGTTELPPEITQMTWSRFFDAYEPMHALVAESSGLCDTHGIRPHSAKEHRRVHRSVFS